MVPLALDGVRRHLRPLRDTRLACRSSGALALSVTCPSTPLVCRVSFPALPRQTSVRLQQVRGVVLYPARIRQRPLVKIVQRLISLHRGKCLCHTLQLTVRPAAPAAFRSAAPSARRAARAACALCCQRRCKLPSCDRPVISHRVRIQAVQFQHRPCSLVAAAACQPGCGRERTRLVCAGDGCAAVIVEDSSVQTIPAQHGVRGIARPLLVQVERLLVGIQCIALAGALFVVLPLFPGKFVLPLLLGVALVGVVGRQPGFAHVLGHLPQVREEIAFLLRCLICPALLVVPPVLCIGHGSLMLRRLEAVLILQRTQQPREAVLLQLVHGQGLVPQSGQPVVHVGHGLLVSLPGHAARIARAVPAAQRSRTGSGILSRSSGVCLSTGPVLPVEFAVRAYIIARIAGRAHAVQRLIDPVGIPALVHPRHRVLRVLQRRLRVLVSLKNSHLSNPFLDS